jgi:tRNA(Ile)-lysidine synthase
VNQALESAQAALAARLETGSPRPLAVAFSGGGDSLALLLMARIWAERAARPLIALTVDHRLQAESAAWARQCAARAERLGIAHQILTWDALKPASGVAAAARQARHLLIAEAARLAGARVALFGHTLDDRLEAEAMRRSGLRVGDPRPWSPSPVWPQGRDIFILRPLLALRRAHLRAWLVERGETWIDDPANDDLLQPRALARRSVAASSAACVWPPAAPVWRAKPPRFGPSGDITLETAAADEPGGLAAGLAAAVLCASGDDRPPRRRALDPLVASLQAGEVRTATLAGARLTIAAEAVLITRQLDDRRSRPCRPLGLDPRLEQVWDGRFAVRAKAAGLALAPLRGLGARLEPHLRTEVRRLPPPVRGAVPAIIDHEGRVSCPTLVHEPRLDIRALGPRRWLAACGLIDHEAKIGQTLAVRA